MRIGYNSSMMMPQANQQFSQMRAGGMDPQKLQEKFKSLSPEQQQAVQQQRQQIEGQLQGAGLSQADVQAAAQQGGLGAVKELLTKAGIAIPDLKQMQTQAQGQTSSSGRLQSPQAGGRLDYTC
jgi:hypothetical protein